MPTKDACIAEALYGIWQAPRKKKAATVVVLRRLLTLIPLLRGLRDLALLLVEFTGALRRLEAVAIIVTDLEPTERGMRLCWRRARESQEAAVTVPLFYGVTELCPVHAIELWLAAAGISDGAVFRRIWLPKCQNGGTALSSSW